MERGARKRQREAAEAKAEALLMSMLPEAEKERYRLNGYFEVIGSHGGHYRIRVVHNPPGCDPRRPVPGRWPAPGGAPRGGGCHGFVPTVLAGGRRTRKITKAGAVDGTSLIGGQRLRPAGIREGELPAPVASAQPPGAWPGRLGPRQLAKLRQASMGGAGRRRAGNHYGCGSSGSNDACY